MLVSAPDRHGHGFADLEIVETRQVAANIVDRFAVESGDDVAGNHPSVAGQLSALQAGGFGGRSRTDLEDINSFCSERADQTLIESVVDVNTEYRSDVLALSDQLRHYAGDRVYWHGEADAGRGAAWAVDGGIDADQAACGIQQRSTGLAGVDGRVGLDQVFNASPAAV